MPQYYVIADTATSLGYTYYAGDNEAKAQKEVNRLLALPTVIEIRYHHDKRVQKIEGLAVCETHLVIMPNGTLRLASQVNDACLNSLDKMSEAYGKMQREWEARPAYKPAG